MLRCFARVGVLVLVVVAAACGPGVSEDAARGRLADEAASHQAVVADAAAMACASMLEPCDGPVQMSADAADVAVVAASAPRSSPGPWGPVVLVVVLVAGLVAWALRADARR